MDGNIYAVDLPWWTLTSDQESDQSDLYIYWNQLQLVI